MAKGWKKTGWRAFPRVQMPEYDCGETLKKVERKLSSYPPLVFAGEVRTLKSRLADVANGESFLLQGGDCAESFGEFNANTLRDTYRVLLQMAVVLTHGAKRPVVKVGRVAGQFAKPRSSPTEAKDGIDLPSYRGDIINDIEFTAKARRPNPKRMLQAYTQSAASLNLLRAFSSGGFADIHRVHSWNLGFARDSAATDRYREIADRISDSLGFMTAAGVNPDNSQVLKSVEFYTSHEALLLEYEEALCRIDSTTGLPVAGSGHLIWIGDRTRNPEGAHVEFCRGVQKPDWTEVRPVDRFRFVDSAGGCPESGKRTGPSDLDRPVSARVPSESICQDSFAESGPRDGTWSGHAIPCMETRSNRPMDTRRARSTAFSGRSGSFSPSTMRKAAIRAASISK